jgi:hypothetical protein
MIVKNLVIQNYIDDKRKQKCKMCKLQVFVNTNICKFW